MNLIEIGKIVNTHGIKGEIKVMPLCDDISMLLDFKEMYLDNKKIAVKSARIHKNTALLFLENFNNINDSERLKNKFLYVDKTLIKLDENSNFIVDIIGCSVFDETTNRVLGVIIDILTPPSHDIYVIETSQLKQILIPVVPQFVINVDTETKKVIVKTIDGMIE